MKRTKLLIAVLGLFLLAQTARADWTAAKRLTWDIGFLYYPALAVEASGRVHVVWTDMTPGKSDIYYKKSTDGEDTWSPNKKLTWNSGSSSWTALAAEATGNLHIVRYDDTPGDYEIYYKKYTK